VFLQEAPLSDLLLIVSHGELNAINPLCSRIYLGGLGEGALELHEIYELNLTKTRLAFLCGCETALANAGSGDDLIGLNVAFLTRGVRSVIGSLWTVEENLAGDLIVDFFGRVRRGESTLNALDAAQQAIRKKSARPYDWAGFVLFGDPS
jgi:CHAT domain-containing protein